MTDAYFYNRGKNDYRKGITLPMLPKQLNLFLYKEDKELYLKGYWDECYKVKNITR